ncbi:MAG: 3-phosphoshikimate 1-carboxyvinyltransferase [Ignavibacteria bacterium]
MIHEFSRIDRIKGKLKLPGDKSISHRAVMFSALAEGKSVIRNLSEGEDVKSTQKCFMQMGIEINKKSDFVEVIGKGFKGLRKPSAPLDAGNSGTTTRLISGILAAQDFESVIIGDESLSVRPMKRIISPLSLMGARIEAAGNFTLPLKIFPAKKINPIQYELPIASAQIKSAVILAGLHSDETTAVIESVSSRNHTEKMLNLTHELKDSKNIIYVSKKNYPEPKEYFVPGDISTAAFLIVLALLTKNSFLKIEDVTLNETRSGILKVLIEMGGNIEIENRKENSGEVYGDIVVQGSRLHNVEIHPGIIPNIIDEIPVLSVAGILADGDFKIKNASELRGKETDRIKAVCSNMKLLGLETEEYEDGFKVSGNIGNNKAAFESFGDHRIAMAFSVLSLLLKQGGSVNNFGCVNISNPQFLEQLKKITG